MKRVQLLFALLVAPILFLACSNDKSVSIGPGPSKYIGTWVASEDLRTDSDNPYAELSAKSEVLVIGEDNIVHLQDLLVSDASDASSNAVLGKLLNPSDSIKSLLDLSVSNFDEFISDSKDILEKVSENKVENAEALKQIDRTTRVSLVLLEENRMLALVEYASVENGKLGPFMMESAVEYTRIDKKDAKFSQFISELPLREKMNEVVSFLGFHVWKLAKHTVETKNASGDWIVVSSKKADEMSDVEDTGDTLRPTPRKMYVTFSQYPEYGVHSGVLGVNGSALIGGKKYEVNFTTNQAGHFMAIKAAKIKSNEKYTFAYLGDYTRTKNGFILVSVSEQNGVEVRETSEFEIVQ